MTTRQLGIVIIIAISGITWFSGCEYFDTDGDYLDQNDIYGALAVVGTYQAEDHTFQKGCSEKSNNSGYTGSGFMDYGGNNSMVEWGNVDVPSAGEYTLAFRYANGSGDRRCFVTVNDTTVIRNVAFVRTGAWTTWESIAIKATLKAGRNKIRVTADTDAGGPNLDKMDVLFEEIEVGTSGCTLAAEGKSATLSCPSGRVITSIDFASYGLPLGSCSTSYAIGTCHASSSKTKVEERCLHKASCTITANNATFGDPCAGKAKKLAIVYSCRAAQGGDDGSGGNEGGMPVFLMAGQSNMEGNLNRDLLDDILGELGSGSQETLKQRLEDSLTNWYHNYSNGYAMYGYSEEMVAFEASELVRLKSAGLVGADVTDPYSKAYCALNDDAVGPLATNCGHPFGPELVLGRYLGTTPHSPTSLIKVAKGGSTLNVDWLSPTSAAAKNKPVGGWYQTLRQRIESLDSDPASVHPDCKGKDCQWSALLWFQGENDSFALENAENYEQNLKNFIADVRSEIGSPKLPVIIVQIGAWAQSMRYGDLVAEAQENVVKADPYAELVVTDDLSGYYHYDPAAQLIIGERIAKSLVKMLKTDAPDEGEGDSIAGCAAVDEGHSATLSCANGQMITAIDFASYGLPTGSCAENFSIGPCHAATSMSKVQSLCLNKPSCTVSANNSTFGDPCPGKRKKLAIEYTCEEAEIFESHVGGYQHAVTSGGFVPAEYDAGFSMYVAAWSLFAKYPGNKSQTGLFGTWMHGQDAPNPPLDRMYSDIEGGLGWWRNTRFATETPKFIMGGVALNFSGIANGPGAGAGTWENPRGQYGVAQLSPWLLFPPDGLNIAQGAAGELLGYGYLPLPLTEPKTVTAGKNVVTGNQCWTLFFNTDNFKGPAAFFLPYFFSKPSVENPALSGMFLDSRPARAGGQISMETQATPAVQAKGPDGRTYAKIAPLLYPAEDDGTSILVHDLFYHKKTALWDEVAGWFAGGAAATGFVNLDNSFHREFSRHSAGLSIWNDPPLEDGKTEIPWDDYRTSIADDPHTNVIEWNRDLVKEVKIGGRTFNLLPEYLVLDESTDTWVAIKAEEIPDATGLKNYEFPEPVSKPEPYTTPDDPNSVWKAPGPVAGPHYAYPGDGSKVTYYWYRFADQPAMLKADMTAAERERVQERVEKLHRNWTKDRNYLPPPAIDKSLASIDPALVVQPPAGLEVGYVPIVTRQESAK